ncbi:MAG: radical SAM protein, partial [Acidobacteria bacterium]|nr:radical SAM protein [Acidobacteriota bacterium]
MSTYELGRQPFGLASPAAWLRGRGHEVTCADLAVGSFPKEEIAAAELVGFFLPMHTATRLAARVIPRVRKLNPAARLCCYGLYAPLNAEYLRALGVDVVAGGEFEDALTRLAAGESTLPDISLERLRFVPPDRSDLPPLARYAKMRENGVTKTTGYTEASRGCRHLCRHCPVVPVYNGSFRVVQREIVMEDIRRQAAAGAEHITFGDPDFFNGPAHAVRIVEELHREFPHLTYDATIKIEHLLRRRDLLPLLRRTGCSLITSAAESVDDAVLAKLDKGHTRADFIAVVRACRENGLALAPTFIPFTPWCTRESYRELLRVIADLELVDHAAPVQLALRLLIPNGSRLLELAEVRALVERFDPSALIWRWRHPDPEIDQLAAAALRLVHEAQQGGRSRREVFGLLWELAHGAPPQDFDLMPRATIPYLDEPWY